jgi:hypothetical protein
MLPRARSWAYTKTIITAEHTLTRQQSNDHYQSLQSCISAGGSFTFDIIWLRQYQPSEYQLWL